jgi:hypothetical protein
VYVFFFSSKDTVVLTNELVPENVVFDKTKLVDIVKSIQKEEEQFLNVRNTEIVAPSTGIVVEDIEEEVPLVETQVEELDEVPRVE